MTKPDQIYTSYLRTTPDKVWTAITNPEFTRQYWAGNINVSDWKKGSKWQHLDSADKTKVYVGGEVLESIPPKRLVLSWVDPNNTSDVSRVTFEIEALTDVVRLTVTHSNLNANTEMATKVSQGWPFVLSSLKSYLETGVGLDKAKAMGKCA